MTRLTAIAAGLLLSTSAAATPTVITVNGTIIDDGIFTTLPLGTPWTLTLTLTSELGTPIDNGLSYTGSAVFTGHQGYTGTDTSTELRVLTTSGGTISFHMAGPGASFDPLKFKGSDEVGNPADITLTLINTEGDPVLLDGSIPDAINVSDFEVAQLFVRVPLSLSPIGTAESATVKPGCAPDLAEPFGTLNFFDVSAFLVLFADQDPAADLALPAGVFNFFDLSAFIAQFNAGCGGP